MVSALSGYLFNGGSDYYEIFLLMIGGILVTAASNGSNQIWEKDIDGLMKRTAKRPLPMKEMSLTEAYIVVAVSLIVGLIMLATMIFVIFIGFPISFTLIFLAFGFGIFCAHVLEWGAYGLWIGLVTGLSVASILLAFRLRYILQTFEGAQ